VLVGATAGVGAVLGLAGCTDSLGEATTSPLTLGELGPPAD
jgi:hypothetical protein